MKISIRDPEKHAIWAIPEANLFLADGANDPIPVNYKELSPIHMTTIYLGIQNKILVAEDAEPFLKLFRPKVQPTELHQVVPEAEPKVKKSIGIVQEAGDRKALDLVSRASELKRLLKSSTKVIKVNLPSIRYADLKTLLDLEKSGKRRKTVIKEILFMMKKVENEVTFSISQIDPNAPSMEKFLEKQMHTGGASKLLSNMEPVVESDQEEISIKFGDV